LALRNQDKTALHVTPDRELAAFRRGALGAIGFHLVSVETEVAALYEISFGRCGVLLLCHRLTRASRNTVAEYFHEHCPDPYIVAILAHEDDHCPPQAHARVVHSDDPTLLVRVFAKRLAA
jgi:hypothetical protein